MVPESYYVALSAVLFSMGVLGVLVRRNPLVIFMSIEMMLNADAHSGARRPRNQVRVQIADAPLEHRAHVDVTDHASGILSGIVICT